MRRDFPTIPGTDEILYANDAAGKMSPGHQIRRNLGLLCLRRLWSQGGRTESAWVVPGIDTVMAAELIALVGDVRRFPHVDKFLAYTGIAPVTLGSGGHESRLMPMFGRRDLSALLHRIASTQLVVYKKTGVPRNPQAKAYYDKHLGEQAGLPPAKRGVASLHEDPLAQCQGDLHRS